MIKIDLLERIPVELLADKPEGQYQYILTLNGHIGIVTTRELLDYQWVSIHFNLPQLTEVEWCKAVNGTLITQSELNYPQGGNTDGKEQYPPSYRK